MTLDRIGLNTGAERLRKALQAAADRSQRAEGGVFEPLDEAEAETLASLLERLGPDAPPRH